MKRQDVFGSADAEHFEGVAKAPRPGRKVEAIEADLDRRDALPDAAEKPVSADLVEHPDFVNQAQRMIERQEIDHWPEFEPCRAPCDRGEKDTGRRGITQGCIMVFREVVAVKAGAIVRLDEVQPLLEMLRERRVAVTEMIEGPEAHKFPSHFVRESHAQQFALPLSHAAR